jgi:hypothetical protein
VTRSFLNTTAAFAPVDMGASGGGVLDLEWGCEAIARAIRRTPRQTYHMLESGLLPAKKNGKIWVADRAELRAHFTTNGNGHTEPTPARGESTPPPLTKPPQDKPRGTVGGQGGARRSTRRR